MGPEVNPRVTRSTYPFTMRRGLFALGVMLLTLPLSQTPAPQLAPKSTVLAVATQPQDLSSSTPFWLDGITVLQGQPPREKAHVTVAAIATIAPRLVVSAPNHDTTVARDPAVDVPREQSTDIGYLPNAILPGSVSHARAAQARSHSTHEHIAAAASRAITDITTDQQFAATFANPTNAEIGSGATLATQAALTSSTSTAVETAASALAPHTTQDGQLFNNGSGSDAQIGNVAVHTEALVQHLQATTPIADNRYDAVKLHTSVTVPAFHHPLHLAVGGGYEHLIQPTSGHTLNALDAPPSGSIDDASTTSVQPDVTQTTQLDMARSGYAASASVPVSHHINVGVGYSQSDLHGNGGTAQTGLVDQHQQQYTGAVTYAPGNGRSSISLVGRASHASDSLAPTGDTDERRGDLLFSVKF